MKNSNRIIKFRARWKDTGKEIFDFMDEYTIDSLNDDTLLVEQWTGLLDKNGKEIYEGDIVRILYTDWSSQSADDKRTIDDYKKSISKNGAVEYKGDRFELIFSGSKGQWSGSLYEGSHGEKEVIGNIYTDAHLLDNKK